MAPNWTLGSTTGDQGPTGCNFIPHLPLGPAMQTVFFTQSTPVQATSCQLLQKNTVGWCHIYSWSLDRQDPRSLPYLLCRSLCHRRRWSWSTSTWLLKTHVGWAWFLGSPAHATWWHSGWSASWPSPIYQGQSDRSVVPWITLLTLLVYGYYIC